MKKSYNHGLLAILTLVVALSFGIANTACYGELVIYGPIKTPSDSNLVSGDGYSSSASWNGDDSHAHSTAYDGPTWSTAFTWISCEQASTGFYTTGGTGEELLGYKYEISIDLEIDGSATNNNETTAYGYASAWAISGAGLDAYGTEDDFINNLEKSLYEARYETDNPNTFDEDYSDDDDGEGECYADAVFVVGHRCTTYAYIINDAYYMEACAKGASDNVDLWEK